MPKPCTVEQDSTSAPGRRTVQPADLDEVVSLPGRRFARQVQARAEDATDTDDEELATANLPG